MLVLHMVVVAKVMVVKVVDMVEEEVIQEIQVVLEHLLIKNKSVHLETGDNIICFF